MSDEIVAISECDLVDPALLAALPAVEDAARVGASRKGAIRALATATEGGVDIAVSDAKPLEPRIEAEVAAIAERHGLSRLSWNGEVVALRAPPLQIVGRARVAPPPGGFLQATRAGEATLAQAVSGIVGDASKVADLFSGCGAFALRLAASAEVHAVEAEAAALSSLAAAWRGAEGLKRITTETRDLFRRPLVPLELETYEAVVIDPPRAGAEAQTRELAKGGQPRIAFVSCNPATFARDARILVDGGYRLREVLPVDQFRWSPHVELVASFEKD